MKHSIHQVAQTARWLQSSHPMTGWGALLATLFLLSGVPVMAQTCTPGPGLAHWNFDGASDLQIDNSSGIAASGGSGCVAKLLKRTDGGSNSTYNNTVGNVDSDYGPVCSSKKSICTGNWDKATPFERYISVIVTYPTGTKGKLSGISFCEMATARTKSGGGFSTNNRPENYRVRLRKRTNGGAWTVVWTGSAKSTTKTDWTGSSSNPVPPTGWGNYTSSSDGFPTQTTDGTATVEYEFQLSAYQNTDSNSSQEIWDLDEIDIAGCCDPVACTPTTELAQWDFDNAKDNEIDNSSGIPASSGTYSGCASVLFKRTDGGSNSVYSNNSSSGDYGPVCGSKKSICTGSWDSATPFDRYISLTVTFPSGKAGKLYGLSFCEMTMNRTKSGGGFVTNNQPENYRVRLLKNGKVIWTGSAKSTTKTTWASATSTPPSGWGNYNTSSDTGFPIQTTDGSAKAVYEFQISAYQSSNSNSPQEIWDLDEVTVFGCCDVACVTPATPTGNDAARCGPGAVNLTAAGCTGGTLVWYAASTGGTELGSGPTFTTPSIIATTTYYVSCRSGLCESGRDPAKAVVEAIPATPTANDVARCGPGTATLTVTGCTTGTPIWYSAPSGGTVLGKGTPFTTTSLTATTTYYVSCSVSTGCSSARDAAMVTINPKPAANAGGDVTTCAGTGVILNGTATGGTPAYAYSWAPVSGLSNSTIRNPVATPSATTTYTLTVTDSKGCTSTDIVRVTINPAPVANAGADVAICNGVGTLLAGTATGGTAAYKYAWSPTTGLSSSNIAAPTATPTATTTYTLTVTDSKGCVDTDVVVVTVNPKPTVTAGTDKTVCQGTSVVLSSTVTGGTAAYTYAWLPATGLSAANVANPTASVTATTSYTLTVTDSKGCIGTDVVKVTVTGLPTTPVNQSFSNVCPATTVSLASLIKAGQELYTNNTHTGSPLTTAQVSSLTAGGTYYLFTVSNGCYSAPATIKVTIVNCNCTSNPTAVAGTDRTACSGAVVALTGASIGGGATQGQWSIIAGGGTLTSTALTANPASVSYTPGANTTTVTLRLTTNDPDGTGPCTPATDDVVITFQSVAVVVGNYTVCSGSSVVLNASTSGGTAPIRYVWSPASNLSSLTVSSPTATPTATTTYTVVATDANGCKASDISVVTVNPKPVVNAGADLNICTGGSTVISASVSSGTGPYTYVWSPASRLSNPAILNPTATPTATSTYTLTVTDSKGCVGSDAVTINVNPTPVASAGSDVAVCAGSRVTLSGTATGGTPAYTYSWAPATNLSSSTIPNPVATPSATTTYTLTVTDSKGCTSTDVVLVTVASKPVVSAGGDASVCAGTSIELISSVTGGSPAYTYSWSPTTNLIGPDTDSPMVTPTVTTTYSLTVTDSKGCIGTDAVVVAVNPKPVANAGSDVSLCTGRRVTLTGTATGGTPAYTYSWAPATDLSNSTILNPVATPSVTTSYTLTVTDGKGCTSTDVVIVTVNPSPTVDAGVDLNVCKGSGIALNGAVSNGTSPYTYAWSPANGLSSTSILNPTASPAATTSYTLTVTDSKGCSDVGVVVVSVESCTQPCGIVNLFVTPGPCNPATNQYSISRTVSFTNAVPGILTITDGATSTTVAVTAGATSVPYTLVGLTSGTGTHTVVATLAGCGTVSETYTAPASCSVAATLVVTSATVCYGATATLTASGCNGTVSWSNGTTGTSLTTPALTAGTSYTATCTTAGSVTTAVGTVTVMPQTTLTVQATNTLVTAGSTVTLTAAGCTGGTISWSTGQQNVMSIQVVADLGNSAPYSATCTTTMGCTATASIVISGTPSSECIRSVSVIATPCDAVTGKYAITGSITGGNVPPSASPQTLTISVGSVTTTALLVGNGPVSFTLRGLTPDGAVRTVNVVSSSSICLGKSTTYTAPASCSVAPPVQPTFDIRKVVNTAKAKLGDVLSYTVTLINTSTTSGSVVATDVLDSKLGYVAGSAVASAGTYVPSATGGTWTVTSLAASATATLTYSASVIMEGIVFNTVSVDSKTVTVCTSIPVRVCAGSNYAFSLSVLDGQNRYQWYKDDVLIQDNGVGVTGSAAYTGTTPNALTVTAAGAYRVVINEGVTGKCTDGSCCPFVVEEVSLPAGLTLSAMAPTCTGTTPLTNGKVLLTGLSNSTANIGLVYQYSVGGTSFNPATALPASATALPGNGELLSNAVAGITYWVRVSGPVLGDGSRCSVDLRAVVPTPVCTCPPPTCVPIVIKKIKGGRTNP